MHLVIQQQAGSADGQSGQAQGLVERDVAAFKGLSHLYCIQIVLGSEKGESTSQQWAGNQILMGNLNPAWSRPQHLLNSIKCPFSGLASIPDGCMCFFPCFFVQDRKSICGFAGAAAAQSRVAALGGNQGRGHSLRHFPTGFLKGKNHADTLGSCF